MITPVNQLMRRYVCSAFWMTDNFVVANNRPETCDTHHLHCGHVLLLLDIDVCNVEPDVTEVSRRLTHLRKHVTRLVDVSLVGQQTACENRTVGRLVLGDTCVELTLQG